MWSLLAVITCYITLCNGTGSLKITPMKIYLNETNKHTNLLLKYRISIFAGENYTLHQGEIKKVNFIGNKSVTEDYTLLHFFYNILDKINIRIQVWKSAKSEEMQIIRNVSTSKLMNKRFATNFSLDGVQCTFVIRSKLTCDNYSKGALCQQCKDELLHPRYFCTEKGERKICRRGFYHPEVDCSLREINDDDDDDEMKPTQSCQVNPCKNNGHCIVWNKNDTCMCSSYYKGAKCEDDVNECEQGVCKNGGTCINKVGEFECQCRTGYTGNDCSDDIDECQEYSPCQNSDLCENLFGGYTCRCLDGYEGQNCSEKMTVCAMKKPCQNRGKCVDTEEGYKCQCFSSFTGKHCETDVDECITNPCKHGGTCYNLIGDFKCHCRQPYTGKRCTLNSSICADDLPCKNGGKCVMTLNGFECECPLGFEGEDCNKDVDECKRYRPCQNKGRCINSVGSFHCICMPYFFGKQCQYTEHECLKQNCRNEGTCDTIDGRYFCRCKNVHRGVDCNEKYDACQYGLEICQNNGTCETSKNGEIICHCELYFNGKYCQYGISSHQPKKPHAHSKPSTFIAPIITLSIVACVVLIAVLLATKWPMRLNLAGRYRRGKNDRS